MTDVAPAPAPVVPEAVVPPVPAPAPVPVPTPPVVVPPVVPAPVEDAGLFSNPTAMQSEIIRLRAENARDRTNGKTAAHDKGLVDAARALAKAAGIELPDEEVSLESVSKSLETITAERDSLKGDVARSDMKADEIRAAWASNVDPAKLTYLQFLLSQDPTYVAIDPTDPERGAKLTAAIAAHVAKDSTLKLAGSAAASGAAGFSGADGTTAMTKEDFAKLSIAEKNSLYVNDRPTYDRMVS